MNEQELFEVLQSYKAALDALIDQNEALKNEMASMKEQYSDKIDNLEKMIFDEILNPAKEAMDKADYESRFNDFSSKYGEKLAPFADQAKAIEGPDYDLQREVFDNYDKMEEKPDADAYVDTVVDKVSAQLDEIKKAFGADELEIKSDEDGDVKIEADGKDVTAEIEQMSEGGESNPESGGGEGSTGEGEEGGEIEDNPDEIAALEKELEAYKG